MTKVFVIDDDPRLRTALSRLLRSAGYDVECFASADAFVLRESYRGVGCLVLDLQMPGTSGIELQRILAASNWHPPIVFLSGHAAIPDSVHAMKLGAVDFLTKPVDATLLLEAVEAGTDRHRRQLTDAAERQGVLEHANALTVRELETARWVIGGFLNKQIAAALGIAEKTVKIHRAHAMQKMEVTSVADLVRRCAAAGIQPVPHRR